MVAASLQERLNYLVNYSSQLIFIGGDTLASQTKALEGFLFQQGENTEIAYVVAEPQTELPEYRHQLCQQLLGQARHLYQRPLNECLASLNNFEGPVMIAITRAEFIPKKLLQELWELVLQSRFGGNKQHLNVVLFADKAWAKEAKSWLPENNSGAPLLLSTQQASLYKANDPSGLHFRSSHPASTSTALTEHQIEQRPLFSMGAFWAALVLLLLCSFAGIAIWQKGDELSALFSPLDSSLASSSEEPLNRSVKSEPHTQSQSITEKGQALVAGAVNIEQEDFEKEDSAFQTVINWEDRPKNAKQIQNTVIKQTATVEKPLANSQLNEQKDKSSNTFLAPQISTPSDSRTNTSFNIPENAQQIPQYDPDRFAIQFAGFQKIEALERYRATNKLIDSSEIYTTHRYGAKWYVVIHSELYDSIEQARNAITGLPDLSNKNSAFVKSTNSINQELRLLQAKDKLSKN
jgi:DamX protein